MQINYKLKDIIFFGLVIVCIGLITYLVFFMSGEVAQCVKNPFVYGAERMKDVSCSCEQTTNILCPAKFSFNDTAFITSVTKCDWASKDFKSIDGNNFNLTLK